MEIKVTELRIGNLILGLPLEFEDNEWETCEVVILDIVGETDYTIWVESKNCKEQFSEFKGIPLTEEWLLKFDIKINIWEKSYRGKYYNFEISGVLFYFFTDTNTIEIKGSPIFYKYVHQLQNLYFALRGEELTIKEKPKTNCGYPIAEANELKF